MDEKQSNFLSIMVKTSSYTQKLCQQLNWLNPQNSPSTFLHDLNLKKEKESKII